MLQPSSFFPLLEPGADPGAPDPFPLALQSGLMVCAAISTAVQLGLPDQLHESKTVALLAQETGTHAPSLHLLLRALASIHLFSEIDPQEQIFGPTKQSQALRADGMADLVKLWGAPYQWHAWMHLAHTIQTGKPALEVAYGEGTTIWSYLSQHPEEAAIFQRGLVANANLVIPAILASYDFSEIRTLVDVGGGYGRLCHSLLATHPGLVTTLFDRAEVIEQTRLHAVTEETRTRLHLTAGNFFLSLPSHADCYLLKNVLMDWDDANYQRILACCVCAMDVGSRLLIIEPVIGPDTAFTFFFSLQMAMMQHAARHRSLNDHQRLVRKVGLTLTRAIPLGLEQWLLELRVGAPGEEHFA